LIGKQVKKDRNLMEVNDMMPVPCAKVHSSALKAEFEKHPKVESYRKEYEKSLLKRLEDIVFDVDKRVFLGKKKCEPRQEGLKITDSKLQGVMAEYESERDRYAKLAEAKGERGDVTGAQEAMQQVDFFRKRIELMVEQHTVEFPGEECCDVCATRYLLGPKRPYVHGKKDYSGYHSEEEHPTDKTHLAYIEIRKWFAKLKEERAQKQAEEKKPKPRSRSRRSKSRSRSRGDRDRKRSRDRSRGSKLKDEKAQKQLEEKKPKPKSQSRRSESRSKSQDDDRNKKGSRDRSRGDKSKDDKVQKQAEEKNAKPRSRSRSRRSKSRSRSRGDDRNRKRSRDRSRGKSRDRRSHRRKGRGDSRDRSVDKSKNGGRGGRRDGKEKDRDRDRDRDWDRR